MNYMFAILAMIHKKKEKKKVHLELRFHSYLPFMYTEVLI